MSIRPKEDVRWILERHGHDYTLMGKSVSDDDPIYGQGSVTWTESTVTGLFDYYNIAEDLFGFGRIETGDARIIVLGDESVDVGDKLYDNVGTYRVDDIKNYDYGGEEVYKILEVNQENG